MIPGFIEVDSLRFYRDIWPRIRRRVDAMSSNWPTVCAAKQAGQPAPDLLIQWGHKDEASGIQIIVAVTHSSRNSERHWIDPVLDT